MRFIYRRQLLLSGLLFLVCCSKDDAEGLAVAPGTYDVSSPVCTSTGKAPYYPSAAYQLALLDFSGVTNHILEVLQGKATESWDSDTCKLSLTRSLTANLANRFSFRADRQFAFSPLDCTMNIAWRQGNYPAGSAYTEFFNASTSQEVEIPFLATATDQGYDLISSDTQTMYDLLQAYGCGEGDHLSISLTKKSPS